VTARGPREIPPDFLDFAAEMAPEPSTGHTNFAGIVDCQYRRRSSTEGAADSVCRPAFASSPRPRAYVRPYVESPATMADTTTSESSLLTLISVLVGNTPPQHAVLPCRVVQPAICGPEPHDNQRTSEMAPPVQGLKHAIISFISRLLPASDTGTMSCHAYRDRHCLI
jgi:hypothetical protein